MTSISSFFLSLEQPINWRKSSKFSNYFLWLMLFGFWSSFQFICRLHGKPSSTADNFECMLTRSTHWINEVKGISPLLGESSILGLSKTAKNIFVFLRSTQNIFEKVCSKSTPLRKSSGLRFINLCGVP